MKNDNREPGESKKKLTPASLQSLRKKGFRYVQVQGFSPDKHLDYMEPRYFVLVPLKNLPFAHMISHHDQNSGQRGHWYQAGPFTNKQDDQQKRQSVYHACYRAATTVFYVGGGSCNGARGRDAAE